MNHGKNIFQWYVYITIRSCAKAYGRGLGQRTNIVCFLWWKMYIYALCGKLNNAHSLIGSYQWSNQGQTHHWQFLAYLLNKTNRFHVDVVCSLIDHGRHQWHSWLCLMWYFFSLATFDGFLPAISTPGGKKHCGEQNYSVWCLNQTESTKYRKFMCKPWRLVLYPKINPTCLPALLLWS